MSEVSLRAYSPADAVAMHRLDRMCFDATFRFSLRAMRSFAEAARAVSVVAEEADGTLAGFAIGEREGEVLYLVTLDVAPGMRRQGLARRMLGWLERNTPGARWMALHVFAGNAEALSFYKREGFLCVGREADFYGRGVDALLYRRQIAGSVPASG